ncbi:hypothetical protein WG904_04555 [Pedobacter sp. Du54]|uniref:hypothetical protein n=1 Tax=Pedobacter anseongensis TaxID=3133439 RepID=UPI0030AC7838
MLSIEDKTQFQSFLIRNFSTNKAYDTWANSYQGLITDYNTNYGKTIVEASELAFLAKTAGYWDETF